MIRGAWLALLLAGSAARAAPPPTCPPPAEIDSESTLPRFAALLKPGATLRVLALGSGLAAPAAAPGKPPAPAAAGAVQPHAAGKPALDGAQPVAPHPGPGPTAPSGLPNQTAYALEAAVPGLQVRVDAIGRHGLTASQMLAPLREALPRAPYRLVLLLTGTVDAVQNVPPDEFYEALAEAAEETSAAGADLVLIDPQYSRFLEANADLEPYETALQAAAALPGVVLFHRFDIMRGWAGDGVLDMERTPKADRPGVAAHVHSCLARDLARMLLGGG